MFEKKKGGDEQFSAILLTGIIILTITAVAVILTSALRGNERSVVAAAITVQPTATLTLTTTNTPAPTNTAQATAATATALPTSTAAMTAIITATPSVTITMTNVPSPTAPATPTNTPAPTPTPTKVMFTSLRTDLPAMKLQDWPRPANDNGWGMHFLVNAWPSDDEVSVNISRMQELHIKWAVVVYGDEIVLQRLAPRFRDAGIMVIWRRILRPYERYYDWGRDIAILQGLGVTPYMQIYNEPSVSQEWPDNQINEQLFIDNLVYACQDVYNAGGYVGLQFVSEDWFRDALREIKARGGEQIFGRMFFVPHSYGMNHPPDYTADINAVLSFRIFAQIMREEIGFVTPMIVGEGGWKWGATDDGNYPKVTDELHRDYYVALYSWFKTGMLSNGEPLPDELFAFCPWLIAHKMDDNAFYDSFAGDRVMTINALKAIPQFTRKFSWSK